MLLLLSMSIHIHSIFLCCSRYRFTFRWLLNGTANPMSEISLRPHIIRHVDRTFSSINTTKPLHFSSYQTGLSVLCWCFWGILFASFKEFKFQTNCFGTLVEVFLFLGIASILLLAMLHATVWATHKYTERTIYTCTEWGERETHNVLSDMTTFPYVQHASS